ncbi:hypothetical protein [Neorhizobium sp. JUb45]|uniref:hypothetical protein n=1 Tax=Neorhizobium sp. JUb45 TaxID=2485113 RepID=UPI00104CC1DA|nr:hypothetical protein [Neorhizobium sp. JUb45]TCR04062.1 hypothetical protein EDF70_102158 [Neorhizobium sp. JUb45]
MTATEGRQIVPGTAEHRAWLARLVHGKFYDAQAAARQRHNRQKLELAEKAWRHLMSEFIRIYGMPIEADQFHSDIVEAWRREAWPGQLKTNWSWA